MLKVIIAVLIVSGWSTFCLVKYDSTEKSIYAAVNNPVMLVVCGVVILKDKISTFLRNRKVRSILFNTKTGTYYCCKPQEADKIVNESDGMEFAYYNKHAKTEHWNASDWNDEWIAMGEPNVRYAPKSVWSRYKQIRIL